MRSILQHLDPVYRLAFTGSYPDLRPKKGLLQANADPELVVRDCFLPRPCPPGVSSKVI
jgi:hypothetical protein